MKNNSIFTRQNLDEATVLTYSAAIITAVLVLLFLVLSIDFIVAG
ncbi:hypothetical protein [Flavobacterium faecale]|nr:hypothetical protein [Flavobacterium faecale]